MELQEVGFPSPLVFNPLQNDFPVSSIDETGGKELLAENLWGFSDSFWPAIQEKFQDVETLYAAIQDIQDEIRRLKETFRNSSVSLPDFQFELNTNTGISGSYFLLDKEGNRKYIIKPIDEDAGCINSLFYSSPFTDCPFIKNIPLYRSALREALAFQVSRILGVEGIVPKTELGIFESESFHDFSESLYYEERKRYEEIVSLFIDKEKLCSVQEYVPNAKSLFEALHELIHSGLSDDEIALRFDQKDFEEANIFLWTTYDTDGHSGNFLVYPKGVDEIGNEILGLKKIDNGLAFPDKNKGLANSLTHLPNAKRELSNEAKDKVLAIDVEKLAAQFEKMGLESAIPALKSRIAFLQELVQKEKITIQEINSSLSKIGKKT